MKKFGNPGTVMPRNGAWLLRPMLLQCPSIATDDAEAAQIVGGLEARGHHQDVDGSLGPVGVDDAGTRHRPNGARNQRHVRLLQGAIEGAGEDGAFAGIRIRRRDRLAKVRAVGELALDVGEAELPAGLVGLGARTVETATPQTLLQ